MSISITRDWNPHNPRLWYADDLRNYPELIALDGSTIPLDEAGILPKYYPGSTLLNDEVTKFTSGRDYMLHQLYAIVNSQLRILPK